MIKRRYEILLPAEFNDGPVVADICPQCIPQSLSEVSDTFGAFTFRPDVALGNWTAAGMRSKDLFRPPGSQLMSYFWRYFWLK